VVFEVRFAVAGQAGEQQGRDENSGHQVVSPSIPPQIPVPRVVEDVAERALTVGDQHNGHWRGQLAPPNDQRHSAENDEPVEGNVQHGAPRRQPKQLTVRVTLLAQL
jgi:hypothetical protein